jgi:hypothetical protein
VLGQLFGIFQEGQFREESDPGKELMSALVALLASVPLARQALVEVQLSEVPLGTADLLWSM